MADNNEAFMIGAVAVIGAVIFGVGNDLGGFIRSGFQDALPPLRDTVNYVLGAAIGSFNSIVNAISGSAALQAAAAIGVGIYAVKK